MCSAVLTTYYYEIEGFRMYSILAPIVNILLPYYYYW